MTSLFKPFSSSSLLVTLLLTALLSACAHSTPSRLNEEGAITRTETAPSFPDAKELSQAGVSRSLAAYRAYWIRSPRYELWLALSENSADYKGRLSLQFVIPPDRFEALDPKGLPLDFERGTHGKIEKLVINSRANSGKVSGLGSSNRLALPKTELQPGLNTVEIRFQQLASSPSDPRGFVRAVDTRDQRTYWFTSHWVDGAQTLFPCFDQPDLKSTFDLTVDAPEDWVVISHALEREVTKPGILERWEFEESSPISPSKLSIAAGPFLEWSSEAEGVPLRILVRQSLQDQADPGAWLEFTSRGIAQLVKDIGNPFPFVKYDQVFLPVSYPTTSQGLTFLPENFLGTPTESPRFLPLADSVYSEFAKAWFGNLITPRWHNGQWIQNALARHAALLSLSRSSSFGKSSWTLLSGEWATTQHSKPTVTRVNQPVSHSRETKDTSLIEKTLTPLYFCSLRQDIGDTVWGKFMQTLTSRFAKKSFTLGDLLYTLEKSSPKLSYQKLNSEFLSTGAFTQIPVCEK